MSTIAQKRTNDNVTPAKEHGMPNYELRNAVAALLVGAAILLAMEIYHLPHPAEGTFPAAVADDTEE